MIKNRGGKMPSALTHINLANNILKLNSNLNRYKFIIGTIMPDCIDFSDVKVLLLYK